MSSDCELNYSELRPLDKGFFLNENVDAVAQELVGTILIFDSGEAGPIGGAIVETEAYDQTDPAAHCFKSDEHEITKESEAMLLEGGHAYVYTASYGYCLNFVTGKKGVGSAVLIRALKPLDGKKMMRIRRGPYCEEALLNEALLCHSPVVLCESLGISDYQNGVSLFGGPFRLYAHRSAPEIISTSRVRVANTIKRHRPKLVGSSCAIKAISAHRRWVDKAHLNCVKEREGLAF